MAKTHAQILAARTGFGAAATGGAAGTDYFVTNLATSGPGSLAYGAGSSDPLMIWAGPGLAGSLPVSNVVIAADKTIALGPSVTLQGNPATHHGFIIQGGNVIIAYCSLDGGNPDWMIDAEGSDGIHVYSGTAGAPATDVFIYRNTFSNWADGSIDTETSVGVALLRATILGNRVKRCLQPFNLAADELTFARQYGTEIGIRFPKVQYGHMHSANNYVEGWKNRSVKQTEKMGQLWVQNDMFTPKNVGWGLDGRVGQYDGPIKWNDAHAMSGTITIQMAGDNAVDAAFIAAAGTNYPTTKPTTSTGWTALMNAVKAEAGMGW